MIQTSLIPVAQTAIAVPAAAVDALAALKSGQVVSARVLEILGQSLARLEIDGSKIDVRSQTPLDVGTLLSLKVERKGTTTRLVPVQTSQGNSADTARSPAQPAAVLSGRAAPASSPSPDGTPRHSLPQAVAEAEQALRQLQQKFISQGSQSSNPVKAMQVKLAADAALILRDLASSSPKLINDGSKPASDGSKSESAAKSPALTNPSAAATSSKASTTAAPVPGVSVREAAARQALSQLVGQDAGRQASAAALFADAAHLMSAAPDKLPPAIKDALSQLLGFRLPADKPVSGQAVRAAFQKSGVLLEARLSEAAKAVKPGAPAPASTLPAGDLKSALLNLRDKLSLFLKSDKAADGQPKQALPSRGSNLPPPPVRAGRLQGQPAPEPAVSARMPASQAAQILIEETRSAISRLRLFQNASLPSQSESGAARSTLARLEWNFEIPLAFGERTDMAQLRIEGEGGEDIEPARRIWNVHVALDTEETGIISGAVMLQGDAVSVNLWAEREDMAKRFQKSASELESVLKGCGLEVERLRIRHGLRRAETVLPGHMVDQSQ